MSEKKFQVTAMGAALVDIYAQVSDEQLAKLGSQKGAMALVDAAQAEHLGAQVNVESQASGGSAANTIAGIAGLGLHTAFIGKVADDDLGRFFTQEMNGANIHFAQSPLIGGDPTGRCLVLITPDAERTMHTLIGAAAATSPDDLDENILAETACFFSEGYVFDSPSATQAFMAGAEIVKQAGGKVAFSLSDPFCVERHLTQFKTLLGEKVDLMLGNQSEAEALFGTQDMAQIIETIQAQGFDAVITRSEKGAVIVQNGDIIEVPAEPVAELVDLTGAGDQFAAGYLSALAQGKPAAACGKMGAIAAAEVITHIGPRPLTDISEKIKAANL